MKLLTSIKPWPPDRAAVFLWRTGNECQESCCFHKVVLKTRQKKKKERKKKPGRLANLYESFIKKKIKSLHISERLTKKPPNPNKSLMFQLIGGRPKGHSFQAVTEP